MGIFSNSDDDDRAPAAPAVKVAASSTSKNVSVIGPTLVFKGELSADEDLLIEGRIEGTIAHHQKHLTVGRHGRVKADIHASSVVILGHVVGDIHSEGVVTLAKGCEVTGDISCARIAMEDGARFSGKINMGSSVKVAATHRESPVNRPLVDAVRKEISPQAEGHAAKSSVL